MSRQKGIPEAVKKYVYWRDNDHCRCCNRGDTLDPHHVVFRSQGGTDTCDNLITLCRKCHDDVHGGRLRIVIIRREAVNIIVEFVRLKGWKP